LDGFYRFLNGKSLAEIRAAMVAATVGRDELCNLDDL
jgi:hypothetical protein